MFGQPKKSWTLQKFTFKLVLPRMSNAHCRFLLTLFLMVASVDASFGQAITLQNPVKEYVYLGSRLVAIDAAPPAAAGSQAMLLNPVPGMQLASANETFSWAPVSGAQNY